ncbi:MAG: glycosyltransferase family 39 protein [Cyanobacteria bacterium]|nr:glycosyltransferase family 39 protein [Cyanobacteriota bacterium]
MRSPVALIVVLMLAGLRLWFWGAAFPNPDEAYYWLWGQHLDGSYFDHPPLPAWIQGVFAAGLGRSNGVLRLPNVLSNGLLLALYGRICQQLYGARAQESWGTVLWLLFTSPLFFLFLAIAWQDHWLILFGTTAGYCWVQALPTETASPKKNWLYATGFCLGLAALCKYLAVFLALGCLGAIATYRPWWRLFRNPHLYGAGGLGLAVTTPVWVWNAHHDWASFQFYLGRSVQAEPSSIQWFGPIFFLLLSGLILGPAQGWAAAKALRQAPQNSFAQVYGRVAIAVALTSTVSLALLSLKAPVLYYWNILAYPLLFPLMAGVFLPKTAEPRHRPWVRAARTAQGFGLFVAVALVIHYAVIPWSAWFGEAGDDDTRMLYGWPTVAAHIQTQGDAFATDPLLLTTDYRSASALAYQLNDPTVMAISGRIDQFDFWYDASALEGRGALLLGDRWHPICPAHLAMFDRTSAPIEIPVQRFGVLIKRYQLVVGYGFHAGDSDDYPLRPDYPLAFTTDGEQCRAEVMP